MKPMLASPIKDINTLKFPQACSPKLDGIRILLHPELGPITRNLKPLPNRYIREKLLPYCQHSLDGEIIIGSPTDPKVFNKTSSGVMSFDGEPEFTYYIFDSFAHPEEGYITRYVARSYDLPDFIIPLAGKTINNIDELNQFEAECLEAGYEGAMCRNPNGKYKFGRSTEKEGILLKLKRFEDCEVKIIGFEERMKNGNEAVINALGYTERSSHKDNMIPSNTLGSLIVEDDRWGIFNVGSGFDDKQRKEIWDNQDKYLGAMVTVKYQPTGVKDKPRFPIFKSVRWDI
jgi:DNA ligase-1